MTDSDRIIQTMLFLAAIIRLIVRWQVCVWLFIDSAFLFLFSVNPFKGKQGTNDSKSTTIMINCTQTYKHHHIYSYYYTYRLVLFRVGLCAHVSLSNVTFMNFERFCFWVGEGETSCCVIEIFSVKT